MNDMVTAEQTTEVLEKVTQVALEAGFTLHPHPNANVLMLKFNMGKGRSQTVYIEHSGQAMGGHDCVTFMSPCIVVRKESSVEGGFNKDRAVDLLRRNARLHFGSFALQSFEGRNDVLMVVSSQMVDTMQVDEFRTHVAFVASAADEFERECGQDVF